LILLYFKQGVNDFLFISGLPTVDMSWATVKVRARDGGAVSIGNAQSKK